MPWSSGNYPSSMKNLQPAVREKAIEIANALLNEGYTDGMAIRIAIAQAHRWAMRHADEEGTMPGRGHLLP